MQEGTGEEPGYLKATVGHIMRKGLKQTIEVGTEFDSIIVVHEINHCAKFLRVIGLTYQALFVQSIGAYYMTQIQRQKFQVRP